MAAPYNPLTGAMPSRATIIARARRRAHADTTAKMAALPSDATLRGANKSLLDSIAGQLADFRGLAGNIGGSYAAAVAPAAASDAATAAQVGAVGAQPVADTRGGLLGAMAGSTYGALQGRQGAAAAGLQGTLTANAGKRSAVAAGENALYEQYLQAGYDDAVKTAAARSNAAIAAGGLGIDQQNADAHMLSSQASASRADTARRKLSQDKKNTTDPVLQKALDKAYSIVTTTLAGKGTRKRTVAGIYHFEIPSIIPGGKPYAFDQRATNGNEARTKAAQFLNTLPTSMKTTYDFSGWHYTNKFDPVTVDEAVKGSRTAALHAAAAYLEQYAHLPHETALAYARGYLPAGPKKKKKRDPNAGGQ